MIIQFLINLAIAALAILAVAVPVIAGIGVYRLIFGPLEEADRTEWMQ